VIRFEEPGEVVHIQTHTSHVFLRGDEVLKIKKPVDFSFLDYSTLELRKACCEKEVALNRRFSPEVYLGVEPLYRLPDGELSFSGEGEPDEYAVCMRRLPDEAMLAKRLVAGDVRADEMTALADVLGRFYETAESTPEIREFGSVDAVRHNTVENFDTTLDFEDNLFPEVTRHLLRAANERFLEENADLFRARAEGGKVFDGHGDLKPENLFLTDAGPVVTDCIEFNERFRYGDVLVDLGYLTMGLLDAGRADLRDAFLDRYRERYENDYPEELLAYYETYRAVVKGKIEGYRSRQPEVPEAEREEARRIALRHFHLAQGIVLGFRPVELSFSAREEMLAPVLEHALGHPADGGDPIQVFVAVGGEEIPEDEDLEIVLSLDDTGDSEEMRREFARMLGEALAE
jgi:aminoglycoside phosphotransferase family enzyme